MKLINEGNWKQELALLKADKVMLTHLSQHTKQWLEENKHFQHTERWLLVKIHYNLLPLRQDKLDKAIETIENVFVRKQCYIDD